MHTLREATFVIAVYLLNFGIFCKEESRSDRDDAYDPPEYCKTTAWNLSSYFTVEDFDICGPSLVPDYARKYYLFTAERGITYRENFLGYKRLRILPNMLRDVSDVNLEVNILGNKIKMPICACPMALQGLASDLGEIDTVRAMSEAGTVMVLSSYSGTSIEDVAKAAPEAIKWMQTYIFPNREVTLDIIRKAEKAGFKAIVVTVDSPTEAIAAARFTVVPNPKGVTYKNLDLLDDSKEAGNPKLTFKDLAWLKAQTRLPIVAKGILTAADALKAALYGVSGILVSNHGGRQLDYEPATIDVLPGIASAVRHFFPKVQVYVDGGVRNGIDIFKALALGANAVFIGRPILWGLAVEGQKGVSKVFDILKKELNQTMMLAGASDIKRIERKMVIEDIRFALPSDKVLPN